MVTTIELNRRGLPHFVVVDADITGADRAALERQGLVYKVRVDESGNSAVLGNPPVNSVAPVASGSLTVGSVLSVTNGTWTNSPTSYAYQWRRDAADIASATANTYTLVTADIGAMVSCRVTATNADGSASANSNALGPVVAAAVAPVLSAASAADFSDIFVWGRATTDTASGTLYAVVVASAATTPTAAQIIAGTDAAGAAAPNANVAITSTGVKDVLVRGLTAVTSYKVCLAHQAAAGNSNVVTGSFTTDTLVIAFATNGLGTNMIASTGSAAFITAQTDPLGGANAIRWVDNNDAASGTVSANCSVAAFFNGVNKIHMSVKHQGGAAWMRIAGANITAVTGNTHWNTSTGALGTNFTLWIPVPPVTFDMGSGWWMWSGQANLAGADLSGAITMLKGPSDNNAIVTRNGTNIQDLYNIRITRV